MQGNARTHGLWEATAQPGPPTVRLCGRSDAEVVIIGAGYTGLSTALHLGEAGIGASVIEAVDIGFGGSGRNVGFVNAGVWVQPDRVSEALGPYYGERLLRTLGEAPNYVFDIIEKYGIECEAERPGTLHCAVGRAGLRDITERAAQWQSRGVPVVLLDAAQAAAKVGSGFFAGALLDPRAGTIQPLSYARGLARAAVARGARIFTGEPVVDARGTNSGWTLSTPSGSITCKWVVVATDAYATDVWPAIRLQQIHLPYFNVATAPIAERLRRSVLPDRHGIWDTRTVLSSARLDAQGRLVFGSVGALEGSALHAHRAWARRAISRIFPQLGDVDFESEWYGRIGMTDNSMPRFHKLASHVIAVSGYNGRGIAPGTVFGRLLAGYVEGAITDEDLPLPATDPVQPSFRRLREIAYEVGSQIVHTLDAR